VGRYRIHCVVGSSGPTIFSLSLEERVVYLWTLWSYLSGTGLLSQKRPSLMSYVLCPVSYFLCPVSCVLCPVSCVLCPVSWLCGPSCPAGRAPYCRLSPGHDRRPSLPRGEGSVGRHRGWGWGEGGRGRGRGEEKGQGQGQGQGQKKGQGQGQYTGWGKGETSS
jgi:hypothetical protein